MLVLIPDVRCWRFLLSVQLQGEIGRGGTCRAAVRLHQDGMDTDPWHCVVRLAPAVDRQPQLPYTPAQRERLAMVVRQTDCIAPPRRGQQKCVRLAQIPCAAAQQPEAAAPRWWMVLPRRRVWQ